MKGVNLAEWAIRHKQIVYFFIISIIIGGIFSYFRLGRSEDPNFTIREMVIAAAWPGATAEQITDQVTYPLERKLQDTKGLDYIKSFTHDGKTVIYVDLKDSVPKSAFFGMTFFLPVEVVTAWPPSLAPVNSGSVPGSARPKPPSTIPSALMS